MATVNGLLKVALITAVGGYVESMSRNTQLLQYWFKNPSKIGIGFYIQHLKDGVASGFDHGAAIGLMAQSGATTKDMVDRALSLATRKCYDI